MKIKNIPFNLDATVKVRLTEEARLYLDNDLARHGAKVVLDEEGYWNGPLRWMVNELALLRSVGIDPIIEIVFKEMDIKIPNEIIKGEIDNIRNAYDSEFKRKVGKKRRLQQDIQISVKSGYNTGYGSGDNSGDNC